MPDTSRYIVVRRRGEETEYEWRGSADLRWTQKRSHARDYARASEAAEVADWCNKHTSTSADEWRYSVEPVQEGDK